MKRPLVNGGEISETVAGALAAFSVLLHLSGINTGIIMPVLSLVFSVAFLIRLTITRRQAVAFCLSAAILIISSSLGLLHDFVLLFLVLLINGAIIAGRPKALHTFMMTSVAISICTAVGIILSAPAGLGERITVGGVNPIWQSWLFCFGFVILFFYERKTFGTKWPFLALLLFALIMTGSRQSIIAALIAIAIGCMINGPSIKYVLAGACISVAFVFSIGARFSDGYYSRGLFDDAQRIELYNAAISEILQNYIGHGFNSFSYLHWDYPHNIILELTHALGFLGLSIFTGIMIYTFYLAVTLPRSIKIFILPLFLLSFTLPQFSGSLGSHRQLYFMMGLVMGLSPGRFND